MFIFMMPVDHVFQTKHDLSLLYIKKSYVHELFIDGLGHFTRFGQQKINLIRQLGDHIVLLRFLAIKKTINCFKCVSCNRCKPLGASSHYIFLVIKFDLVLLKLIHWSLIFKHSKTWYFVLKRLIQDWREVYSQKSNTFFTHQRKINFD